MKRARNWGLLDSMRTRKELYELIDYMASTIRWTEDGTMSEG